EEVRTALPRVAARADEVEQRAVAIAPVLQSAARRAQPAAHLHQESEKARARRVQRLRERPRADPSRRAAVTADGEGHLRRLRAHAELREQADEPRVVALVED